MLENNQTYYNKNPKCEPQLGKRGLYEADTSSQGTKLNRMAILWVLNLSDGNYTLLDIAKKSGIVFDEIKQAADVLLRYNLLAASTKC
ncbi:MAG: winged helix-turn-helix domain-containing protein [Rivularia sp. (in: cyanobacteria)]